ncbi:cysteine desulfurase [Aerococcus sanguinicola]|uniref:Cysteine desulfurase n=1 Tax=Aerococcus sanguinicola TaxID=119206 RepID=A0A0X8F9T6_9LACT|nr:MULTISPECIES: hypothetical protein [Aerococcus]AMB93404.1 hypothetical protein AWM72_00780 [Aerococcus sanguinicola]OFT92261.1 hypothetical protein HMPREF3090_09060 [Aerococcus sp. HMSC23C02]PKZ22987.1 cysteine desulfurase [Aerococcus sanguinicola]
MAYPKTAKLPGGAKVYQLHPDCKKYSLRDYHFVETKSGNFQYDQEVKPDFASARAVRLKITVDKELTGLKMNVTNQKGLKTVNVFKSDGMADFVEALDFILADMEKYQIIQVVSE